MILADVRTLFVKYNGVPAINNVTLQVLAQSLAVLIGPNGAGKSSLLKSIMGLAPVSSGEIWFGGQRIDGLAPHEIAKSGVAIVLEGRRLFPQMTVLDNLLVGAYTRSRRGDIKKALEDVWRYFPQLRKRKNQHADTLSGGEQQMCAIGRALMSGAKFMLLDEPSLGLAPVVVKDLANIIKRLCKERGLAMLMAEQNAHMALRIADYGYVLEQGRITMEGSGQDLMTNEDVIQAYIGID